MGIMTYTREARCGDCKFCERYYKKKKDGTLYKYCYYKCERTGEIVTYMKPVCKEWELD